MLHTLRHGISRFPESSVQSVVVFTSLTAEIFLNKIKMSQPASEDLNSESVEVLRERLNSMKRIMAERNSPQSSPASTEEIWSRNRRTSTGIIDGNFLSVAFGGALLVIVTVSVYAFYNLYHAILKKFPSHHTEL